MSILFTKLRDGSWGLRFTNHSRRLAVTGTTVTVEKRDGSRPKEVVGAVVARTRYAITTLIDTPVPVPTPAPAPADFGSPVITFADRVRECGVEEETYALSDAYGDEDE